jgi:hypothetical protein
MVKLKVLLGLIGIVFLVWAIGIVTGFWGNPLFSYFWIASNNLAYDLSYLGLGVGAFLLALTVIIYYKNSRKTIGTHIKLSSGKSSENVPKRKGNGLIVKLTVPLSLIGIGFLVWSVGIAVGLWGNSAFSYFWIASNDLAYDLSYLGLGVGAFLVISAIILYYRNTRTNKIFIVHNHLRQLRQEFYNDLSKKNQQLLKDCDPNYPVVLMNGRRSDLGSEEMEKIVT